MPAYTALFLAPSGTYEHQDQTLREVLPLSLFGVSGSILPGRQGDALPDPSPQWHQRKSLEGNHQSNEKGLSANLCWVLRYIDGIDARERDSDRGYGDDRDTDR